MFLVILHEFHCIPELPQDNVWAPTSTIMTMINYWSELVLGGRCFASTKIELGGVFSEKMVFFVKIGTLGLVLQLTGDVLRALSSTKSLRTMGVQKG